MEKKTQREEKQTITFKYFQMSKIVLFFMAETTCAILFVASCFCIFDLKWLNIFGSASIFVWTVFKSNSCAASLVLNFEVKNIFISILYKYLLFLHIFQLHKFDKIFKIIQNYSKLFKILKFYFNLLKSIQNY